VLVTLALKMDILTLHIEPLVIQRRLNECPLCSQKRHALKLNGNLRFTKEIITLACPRFCQILNKAVFSEFV